MIRVFAIIFFTTAIGGLIFQSTTFALPRSCAYRLGDFAVSATQIGWLHANGGFAGLFSVLAVAAALIFCATGGWPASSQMTVRRAE